MRNCAESRIGVDCNLQALSFQNGSARLISVRLCNRPVHQSRLMGVGSWETHPANIGQFRSFESAGKLVAAKGGKSAEWRIFI